MSRKTTEEIIAERQETHGDPRLNFGLIAEFWNVYIEGKQAKGGPLRLDEVDVAQMMVLLKVARTVAGIPHVEHFEDQSGYSEIARGFVAPCE